MGLAGFIFSASAKLQGNSYRIPAVLPGVPGIVDMLLTGSGFAILLFMLSLVQPSTLPVG
jgi:hypothetical protein